MFISWLPVAYTVGQMNFKWKEDNPVRIFNRDLAEFDVVKYEILERNATYVSGKQVTVFKIHKVKSQFLRYIF